MSAEMTVLNENWLNSASMTTSSGGGVGSTTLSSGSTGLLGNYNYYHTYPSGWWVTQAAPLPIRLTMAEVDKLRKAAKADDALKAVLAKFTKQIEVIVDF